MTCREQVKRIAADIEACSGRMLVDIEMFVLGDELPLDVWCERVRKLLDEDSILSQLSMVVASAVAT
ncbi:hypothetical protein [Rhodococcus sp. ARC_M6]|uniref:hypothetical protein n=1 Tax=Rhodococcus sp. ARC_M6 TaxID=2928852 RepID=UPI001FB2A59F|nr:hypothetical protein [Rhodococcus sp. ARC_M6]MCJ0907022.1 hypothetical protein [Rhodococcus sp. ARC_M6]